MDILINEFRNNHWDIMEEQSWNLEKIQQLVKDRIPEDQYMEYKSQRR